MVKPKKYLFKRRRYGWGWTPVSWQAWVIVALPLGLIIASAFLLPSENAGVADVLLYLGVTCLLVLALIVVAAQVSPKPKWRWGKKKSDNPDEDF